MGKDKSVFGIFKTRGEAENAVDSLRSAGFMSADISVLLPQSMGSQDLGHIKSSKAPEGATVGAGTGAVIGGTLGLLIGIGSLAIPGVGPLIAAGPIMASLAGMGVGGAVGVVSGALIGYGLPEYEAKRYEGALKEGGILLSVHSDSDEWQKKAKDVLERLGAKDISVVSDVKPAHETMANWKTPPPKGNVIRDDLTTRKDY